MLTTWVAEHLAEEHGWRLEPGSPLHVHLIRMIAHLQVEFARREDETLNGNLGAMGDVRFSPDQYGLDEARGLTGRSRKPVPPRDLFAAYVQEA